MKPVHERHVLRAVAALVVVEAVADSAAAVVAVEIAEAVAVVVAAAVDAIAATVVVTAAETGRAFKYQSPSECERSTQMGISVSVLLRFVNRLTTHHSA
jgi:hypothetical protein